jgi:hypothetical protein
MRARIVFWGLVISAAFSLACGTAVAATPFEDDFNGATLDTVKWTPSGPGTVAVSGGNVTLDVPSGDWAYSQMDSASTWTAADDLYYSFKIGGDPQGNYNIFQVFEGTAQTGYVAMRNDTGLGGWWFDARQGLAGSPTYHGYEQPGATGQTMSVGDVFTLKLGPGGSAAYKNGVMFDSTTVVPAGTLMIDAQCWREPGGVASQTFDYIGVSDTAPVPEPGAFVLVASALVGLLGLAWRKRK